MPTKENQRELIEAVGDLAMQIAPHHMDKTQRQAIGKALHVLVDHILALRTIPDAD